MMNYTNKEIPLSIKDQVEVALSHYPQLKDTPIAFRFKKEIKKSTMQAQPSFASFLKSRKNRAYIIFISEKFHIEDEVFSILDVEDDVLIGWIGHELGHVMDYRDRGTLGMAVFGLKYLFSTAHIQEVERAADTYAVKHGMYQYILATKNFILNNTSISPKYKNRIKRLYMSPEEIMELVNHLDIADVEKEVEKELQKENL
ncbi:MAG: hypothetical protein ABGW76_04175 [Mesonia sp.]|jgi:hypothetical protein|uniref:hypothetical protein n=1 Tax=Mesonia sp. TaxID=1960830 RepID=UPI0032429781